MSNFGKTLVGAAIFVAGYLVGRHEMKYETMKLILTALADKQKKDEEGSQ